MKKVIILLLFCLGILFPLFSQQRIDVNGDGILETVYSNPGKRFFYRIEFDFNNDGRNDIILNIDENTGRYLSLDVVRTTWPIPSNIGTQQWVDSKRSACIEFWNNHSQNNANCDICNTEINRNTGYILSSQDILANLRYVNYDVYYGNPLTSLYFRRKL